MVFLVMDDIFDADSSKEVMFGVPIFDQIMEYIACETKANIFNSGMLSTGILSGRCVCVWGGGNSLWKNKPCSLALMARQISE